MNYKKIVVYAAVGSAWINSAALAQQTGNSDDLQSRQRTVIDEITVTATRRAQSLQDVAIAISAVTSEQLDRTGITSAGTIGPAIPNAQSSSALGVTSVFLRGVGSNQLNVGSESSVAYYADGVYISQQRAQTASFFDVERVEIVRGPQGDLYGRNATGGAVSVITRRPKDEFSGNVQVSYGNYNAVRSEGGVDFPISDTVRARLAGYYSGHDGYGENVITGHDIDERDEYAIRLSSVIDPTERLSIDLVADYFKADDSLGGFHVFGAGRPDVPEAGLILGGVEPDDLRDVAGLRAVVRRQESYGVALTTTYDISNALSLKSITAYRESDSLVETELTRGSPVLKGFLNQPMDQSQFSQEIQLQYTGDQWNMVTGVYYFNEDLFGNVNLPFEFIAPGIELRQHGSGETDAYAIFANIDWSISDKWSLITGLRYSYETRTSVGEDTFIFSVTPIDEKNSWSALTPKVGLQYHVNEDYMIYGSVSRGFKSGAYLIGQAKPELDPEFVWSYELGLKATAFDGRLQANLAAFYYDYSDLVVFRVVGLSTILENAASATNQGLEAEIVFRPDDHWRFDVSAGFLDATYESYMAADPTFLELGVQDLSGNTLNNAPELSARLGVEYGAAIGADRLVASMDLLYQSEVFFSPFNLENAYTPGHSEINAKISYEMASGWSVSIFGRNLGDKLAKRSEVVSSDAYGYPRLGSLNEPRIFGVEVKASF